MRTETSEDYNQLYAKYYDILTQHKDYASETKKLNELIDSIIFDQTCPLLDIGCGTGTHSIQLSKLRGNPISAFDISEPMLAEAIGKDSRVDFLSGQLSDLDHSSFSFAYSLFNVVNHITEIDDLTNFFAQINQRITVGGYYFFEFWNRAAVLRVPPVSVTRVIHFDNKKLIRIAQPDTTYLKDSLLSLDYQIEIVDANGNRSQFESFHKLKLHDLGEFQKCLSVSGFEINFCRGALPSLGENANEERMLSILAKKTSEPLF